MFCFPEGADQGAGHPDFALYTARLVQKGRPRAGQIPERGAVAVKGMGDGAWLTAQSDQVSRYWGRYQLVLVTNLHNFILVGKDESAWPAKLETFRLAENADDFQNRLEKPRTFAREVSAGSLAPGRLGRAQGPGLATCFILHMPVTAWPVSKQRRTRHPLAAFGWHWRKHSGFALRASAGSTFSIQP